MKKLISVLLMSFLTLLSVQAKDAAVDYVKLAREGTAEEIKDAVKSDSRLYTRLFGSNRENFLMLLLHGNRSLDIIKLGVMSGIDVTTLSKDGRSSVMYACRYVTDPKAVKYVIKSGTVFGIGIEDRLTKKDDSGKSCFDYVKDNPNYSEIYPVLTSFADDPEVIEKKKQEKEAAKKAKKEAEEARKAESKQQKDIPAAPEENSGTEENTPVSEDESSGEGHQEEVPQSEDDSDEVKRISASPADKVTYTVTPVIVADDQENTPQQNTEPEKTAEPQSVASEIPETAAAMEEPVRKDPVKKNF